MQNARRLSKAKIGIVGAGPCGMTLAMLLAKLGVKDFTVLESKSRDQIVNSHPAAHYLNSRSLEIFESLGGLGSAIRSHSEDLDRFRYYRYCRRIGGFTYQVTDQLSADSLEKLSRQSSVKPGHMPQNKLCELMLDQLDAMGVRGNLQFSSKVEYLKNREDGVDQVC